MSLHFFPLAKPATLYLHLYPARQACDNVSSSLSGSPSLQQ
jgi:hypothetical protein